MNINHNNVPEALGILIEKVDFFDFSIGRFVQNRKN